MKKSFLALAIIGSLFLAACEKADEIKLGNGTATENALAAHPVKHRYSLNEEQSVIEWRGAGPATAHNGSFAVRSSEIEVVNGKVKGGTFVIPIASIQNFDLPDEVKPVLLEHLKSPDFFDIALYPEASFRIKRVTPLTRVLEGASAVANSLVTGDFTMIGQTQEITFPAQIEIADGNLQVEAIFSIDRTRWGMHYAADPALGDHHIYPEVGLHLKLVGSRK